MKIRRHTLTLGELFASLSSPKETPTVSQMRGNSKAEIVLLSEHPEAEDYTNNAPMTGPAGSMYSQILTECEWDMDESFLILPFSRFGPKPSTASARETFPFLQIVQEQAPKKLIAVLGMTAFSHVFAGGRKTHSSTIIGNPMWIPSIKAYVYVLPDSSLFTEEPANFKEQKNKEQKLQSCFTHAEALRKFAISKSIKVR